MNTKKFLKPDLVKVTITVLLISFIIPTSFDIVFKYSMKCYDDQCSSELILGSELFTYLTYLIAIFIFPTIASYLLSCFIVRFYDMVKKK